MKDPAVRCADDWDFPTKAPLDLGTLARTHRGTPWQTVSLKRASATLADWQDWIGQPDADSAALMHPDRDARLAEFWLAWTGADHHTLGSVNDRTTTA